MAAVLVVALAVLPTLNPAEEWDLHCEEVRDEVSLLDPIVRPWAEELLGMYSACFTDPPQPVQAPPRAERQSAPPSTPKPAKATSRGNSGVEQWRGLVASYFPADQVDTALRVMACESGGNPNAKNPRSSATGLMQVLASLWAPHFGIPRAALYDPETNIRIARKIWDEQGWRAWNCY